ncbi:MAG: class I SAM-dependent methyltransferase [Phycisphaerales bacterium]
MPSPVMNIDAITPSFFFPGPPDADHLVRRALHRYDALLSGLGTDAYNMRRFRSSAFHLIPLWLSLPLDLSRLTVLELGCGRGLKGLAWADLFAQYVGVDLDAHEIAKGRAIWKAAGRSPDELIHANAADLIRSPSRFGIDRVDVLVLYAVLEHLTPEELDEVFELLRECYDRGTIVLVAESPNRLYPFDHHSTGLHFVQMLPYELGRRYLARSANQEIVRFARAPNDPDCRTQFHRSGRGISYHDFEVRVGPPDSLSIAADGFHPILLDVQPLARAELALLDYFEDNGMHVPRSFARAWIDLLLWRDAPRRAPRSLKFRTPTGGVAEPRKQFWQLNRYTVTPHDRQQLLFDGRDRPPDATTSLLLIDCEDKASGVEVHIDNHLVLSAPAQQLLQMRPPTWHAQIAVPLHLSRGSEEITVRCPRSSSRTSVFGLLHV